MTWWAGKGVKRSAVFIPGDAQKLQQGHGKTRLQGSAQASTVSTPCMQGRQWCEWLDCGHSTACGNACKLGNVSCSTSSSSCGRRCWQTWSRRGSCAGADLLLPHVCSSEEKRRQWSYLCPLCLTSTPWLSPWSFGVSGTCASVFFRIQWHGWKSHRACYLTGSINSSSVL